MSNKAFPFFYDWCEEMRELDGNTFKKFVLSLSEYHKTQNKTILDEFKGLERVCLSNMINQLERIEQKRIAGRKGGKRTVENKSGAFSVLEADLKHSSSTNTNTNTNTDTNTNTNTNNSINPSLSPLKKGEAKKRKDGKSEALLEEQFNELWSIYPKKKSKVYAKQVYYKLVPSQELHKTMLEAVKRQKLDKQWQDEQFIPELSTWLNREKWNDEPTTQNKYCAIENNNVMQEIKDLLS